MRFRGLSFFIVCMISLSSLLMGQSKINRHLWEIYEQYKVSPQNQAIIRHNSMMEILEPIIKENPDVMKIEQIGESVEKRSINLVTVGSGPNKILLWSQMHGDEPTATCALLDILNYISKNIELQLVRDILTQTTLLIIPMLNPDGAERFTRRNAQDIDINRDARYLQSPEGRILKRIQEIYNPEFGFNLHDQRTLSSVGKTKKVAAISLLSPPYDYEDNDNATRILSKKVAAVFYESIAPFAYGFVSKYDADYMPRSFGDLMQSYGMSTVLVESGGWTDIDRSILVKINFIGLLSAIHSIADGSYLDANPALYEGLRRSGEHNLFNLKISNVMVLNGIEIPPFRADIGVNYSFKQTPDGPVVQHAIISDIGDLNITSGKLEIDGSSLIVTPGLIAFNPEFNPEDIPSESDIQKMMKKGILTIIGEVDMTNKKQLEKFEDIAGYNNGINIGFIGNAKKFLENPSVNDRDLFIYAMTRPLLSLLPNSIPETLSHYIDWFGIQENSFEECILSQISGIMPAKKIPTFTSQMAKKLGLGSRGTIWRGAPADLLLFEMNGEEVYPESLDLSKLKIILFNGEVVYQDGSFLKQPEGKFLSKTNSPFRK
jgi:hypothetical protein